MILGTSTLTLLYWAQIAPSSRGVFAVGAVVLLLTAVAALDALQTTLHARALRAGDPRSGAGLAILLIGPLLGAPLAIPLCLVAAGLFVFLEDVTGVPDSAFAAVCALGAAVLLVLVVARERRRRPQAPWLLHIASVVAALLLVLATVVLLVLLAFGSLRSSFAHLTSASYAGQRYHLAREDIFLEHPRLHLYRCDALGLICQEVDAYGSGVAEHGLLQVDEYAGTVTALAEDGHVLFTYTLRGAFAALRALSSTQQAASVNGRRSLATWSS